MPDKIIVDFINDHHILTIATSKDNISYCCNVFYIYDENKNFLIFSSDYKTKHACHFMKNPKVSGSIYLHTNIINEIKGLQLQGYIMELKDKLLKNARKKYIEKFPSSKFMNLKLWAMKLMFIKMTNNTKEFGKKLIWQDSNDF